jgi:hypothetical protein
MPLLFFLSLLSLGMVACTPEEPPKVRTAPAWFPLSEQFTASGFMGEGGEREVLKLYMDRCPRRDPGALGNCFTFDYRPKYLDAMSPFAVKWFGVAWQSPPNNWGEQPGKLVEAGATRIRLKVRGSREGSVRLEAGGIGIVPRPDGTPFPYHDEFIVPGTTCKFNATEWSECTLELEDREGDWIFEDRNELEILGPFKWSFMNPSREPITIYFDDIVWEED